MRIGRRTRANDLVPISSQEPRSLIASAARIKMDGLGWRTYKFGDDTWQTEAWRLYDIVGELRFVANWIGSACSRVRIYVAKVDDNGRVQKEVTEKKLAGLADTLFGGPPSKAEALRMLGINLTVAGDCFIVGKSADDPKSDEWYVVSTSELKRWGSSIIQLNPDGSKEHLDPKKDLVIRVWTPHPRRNLWPDSPTHAALPMLWEIERLTRYVFAQIDSRLVSAGLLPIPKEVSFPDEDPELSGAEQLTSRLMKTGSASLKGDGTAAGVVPTFVEMPMEALGKIDLIQFSSELSKQALELRAEALRRFALAMDIEPSILTGAGEANHWGAWQIMEGQINVHIVPLMTRICDALTTAYLQPALNLIGEDEERYVFWYDTSPLTVRPERLKDSLELYDKGLVSRETVLLAGNYKISDAPEDDEDLRNFTRELMLRDPNLFQIPAVRKVAGYTEDVLPSNTVVTVQQPGQPGAGPPPPPPPPTGISQTPGGPMPVGPSEAQNALEGPPPAPSGVTAALARPVAVPASMNVFVVANATVLRALERAGKRLLDRHSRDKWPDVPPYELHTRIRVGDQGHAARLLDGAWDHLSILAEAVDPAMDCMALQGALQDYCSTLLVTEQPHHVNLLGQYLTRQGLLNVQGR
jgi:hypothetical protein